jgi:hypothetical protein
MQHGRVKVFNDDGARQASKFGVTKVFEVVF